jgi:GDP-L-fucose synthase
MNMDFNSKIYIAGHRGMVGSAILRNLQAKGFSNFVLKPSEELDLRDQQQVSCFFHERKT